MSKRAPAVSVQAGRRGPSDERDAIFKVPLTFFVPTLFPVYYLTLPAAVTLLPAASALLCGVRFVTDVTLHLEDINV